MEKSLLENRVQLWSSGGGVQSSAIAVLIAQGKLQKPDLAVMVDTERESTAALEYQREFIIPMLKKVGVDYQIIKKSKYTKVDLTNGSTDVLLPPFATKYSGTLGRQPGWCSVEWKRRVVRRWANEQRPKSKFDVWIGFSTDELRRVKPVLGKWRNYYPLINMRLSRSDCQSLVINHGLPTPPRSACWMCPNRGDAEWLEMKNNQPDDFKKAVKFEREIQINAPWLTLHQTGKNIDLVDLNESQGSMFGTCDTGMCFI